LADPTAIKYVLNPNREKLRGVKIVNYQQEPKHRLWSPMPEIGNTCISYKYKHNGC